ncbi:MAG: hypothetical protein HYY34_01705 [Chloroflexi bacterium]|nr:hypothetical protein [Chloroflexota bacterium]
MKRTSGSKLEVFEMTGQVQVEKVSEYGETMGPEVIWRKSLLRVGDEETAAFELFLRGVEFRGPCGNAALSGAGADA